MLRSAEKEEISGGNSVANETGPQTLPCTPKLNSKISPYTIGNASENW